MCSSPSRTRAVASGSPAARGMDWLLILNRCHLEHVLRNRGAAASPRPAARSSAVTASAASSTSTTKPPLEGDINIGALQGSLIEAPTQHQRILGGRPI